MTAKDTTPPMVISMTPADGAKGVGADTVVVIEFSEPMDQLSVQNSIDTTQLGSVSYAWTNGSAKLTITPAKALDYAEGNDLATVKAKTYHVVIGTGGKDEAGNALPVGKETTFSTSRKITASLPRVDALTASADPGAVSNTSGDLYIGDDGGGGVAKGKRGFVTMDLASLPSDAQKILSGTLKTLSGGTNGSPFTELGVLLLDHVTLSVATNSLATATSNEVNAAFNAAPLSAVGTWMTDEGSIPSIDVTAQVADDLANRSTRGNRSHYRARLAMDLNLDGNKDGVLINRNMLALDVVYLTP